MTAKELVEYIIEKMKEIDDKHHEAEITTAYDDANAYHELMEFLFKLSKEIK